MLTGHASAVEPAALRSEKVPSSTPIAGTGPTTTDSADEQIPVLVVDDDVRNRTVLRALIADLGADLIEAASGEEALKHLLERDFGLILLDLHMPGMDGLETAALIRTRERSRFTPIIFLTAFDRTDEQLVRGYRLGAVDFLSKPIQPPEVLKGKVSFFIELYRKSCEIRRQWELIRAAEHREHARNLEEIRRRLEADALRREMERERELSQDLQRANARLEEMGAERARLIEELQRQAEELREADRRKDEFLAVLAHELRNPLAPIVNALGFLRSEQDGGDARGRVVAAATRQANHMARLVDDLVDVARIRSGKVALQRSHVDVGHILDDATQAVEPLMRECRHELRVTVDAAPLFVEGDPIRLAQIFQNLLNNAAKYTDPGGHVDVEAAREGSEVVVRVRDDGVGIDPAHQRSVFDLFVQCDQSADRSRGGLGLGLSLVRSLVLMHGGTVCVHSDGVGRGSTFTIRLPALADASIAATASEPRPAPERSSPRTVAKRLRIAVVDDNDDIRETLRALLELRGHVVLDAADGAAGVALVTEHAPDVALVDIGLPGMDGFDVAAALRSAGSSTHLIAVSGYGRAEDRARASEVGFDAHLVKPVDPDALDRLLQHLAN
jgi:signal transduction histidine kinase